ncbi:MAG: type II toxin-antitoxin system VapC family toxin [Micrococcales bacterium]|nr:type II toxin-antitoxin system VapC family toxin [Micrococcales bacterium]
MTVCDASALLAFLQGEPGAQVVEQALVDGAVCSAANWSEVAQKVVGRGGSWPAAKAILTSFDLAVEPVTAADAERAADLWQSWPHLSLGDRLCLALAYRLDVVALTADQAWAATSAKVQLIRGQDMS